MCGLLFALPAYLLGSIPTGVIVARLLAPGVDLQAQGSGNIGATNALRVLGKGAGILTLAGDLLKGALAVLLVRWVAAGHPGLAGFEAIAGFSAVLGHMYPIFMALLTGETRGGKGVATAAGVFLVIAPAALGIALAVFALLVWRWRYVSLGSIGAAATLPVAVLATNGEPAYVLLGVGLAALVIFRHKGNIGRLMRGEENRFSKKPPVTS